MSAGDISEMRLQPEATAPTPTEPVQTAPRKTLLDRPLRLTLLLSLLCLALLQCWRPLYHLTDDNLTAGLPQFIEFSQRLWSGQNPFITEHLFGGHYNYLHDAGIVSLLSPFMLLCTPLGTTSYASLAIDIVASLNLLTIALVFCWCGLRLRELLGLRVSNGSVIFLSVSYAFSPFNLVVNPSWLGFINPEASLPLMVVAWFEPRTRRALALTAAATLFALAGGHLHPFIYMNVFMGLLSLAAAWHQGNLRPVFRQLAGTVIGLILFSPVLIPITQGFFSTIRNEGVSLHGATLSRVPLHHLLASFFLGPGATSFLPAMRAHSADPTYAVAIAFSLANLPVAWIFARKREWSRLEVGLLCLVFSVSFLIIRPDWLQNVMFHVPMLRSLRWPFREIADLLFFVHLLALLNLGSIADRRVLPAVIISGASMAVVLLAPPPTFNAMRVDRSLVLSGQASEYWTHMKARLGPEPRIIVAGHPELTIGSGMQLAPFSLMGAYNYACMFGIVNVSGYSPTQADSKSDKIHPFHFGGIYWYPHAEALWRSSPGTTLIEYLRHRPCVLRVRHEKDTFYVIYDELRHELTETSNPKDLEALPPMEPLWDPTKQPKDR